MSENSPLLSIVLPIFDEVDVVATSLAAIAKVLHEHDIRFEFICVDDGSTDGTEAVLMQAKDDYPTLTVVQFSRNFGKESALAAGMMEARGDGVLVMDIDLQHPPKLIPQMYKLWRDGNDVVEAVKSHCGEEGLLYGISSKAFNRMMSVAVGKDFSGASDFKLLSREVVDIINELPETNRFFRGLVAWIGFRVARIPVAIKPRRAGTSRWSTLGLIWYSIKNLLAFSIVPLQLVAGLGFLSVFLGFFMIVYTLVYWLAGFAVTGFTTTIVLVVFVGCVIQTSLGIVALYVSQLYSEAKSRPLFIRKNHPEPTASQVKHSDRAQESAKVHPPESSR